MEPLFDLEKPYFAAWPKLHDIDPTDPDDSTFHYEFWRNGKSAVSPLYYAALCGFQDLVKNLILKYPQHVYASLSGGGYVTPLGAALAGKYFQTAELLHLSGADPNVQCYGGNTPLHAAAYEGHLDQIPPQLLTRERMGTRNYDGVSVAQTALDRGFLDQIPEDARPRSVNAFSRFLRKLSNTRAPF